MIYLCTITTPVEGKTGTYCPTCRRILDDDMFRRRMTPAQARARGFPREGEAVYERWTVCRECAPPKRKTLKTMTSHQIMREIDKGNLRASSANYAAALAKTRENEARRQGVLKRWDEWWAARWDYARQRLRDELARTTQRIYYARDNPHPDDPEGDTHTFLLAYREHVKRMVAWFTDMRRQRALGRAHARRVEANERPDDQCRTERRRGRPRKPIPLGDRQFVMDEHSEWADFIKVQDLHELRDHYMALPTVVRVQRLSNPPLLLMSDADSAKLCLWDYPEIAEREAARQRRAAMDDF